MDVTVNRPEIVAGVPALLERYEQALIDKDVAVLDTTFRDSPHAIRCAVRENGYGFAAISAARLASAPVPGHLLGRRRAPDGSRRFAFVQCPAGSSDKAGMRLALLGSS